MKSITIKVLGKVQGVWFRASTQQKAIALGLCGTVQNHSDGTVFIEVAGKEKALEKFVAWCRQGPPNAMVEDLIIEPLKQEVFNDFVIIR